MISFCTKIKNIEIAIVSYGGYMQKMLFASDNNCIQIYNTACERKILECISCTKNKMYLKKCHVFADFHSSSVKLGVR